MSKGVCERRHRVRSMHHDISGGSAKPLLAPGLPPAARAESSLLLLTSQTSIPPIILKSHELSVISKVENGVRWNDRWVGATRCAKGS